MIAAPGGRTEEIMEFVEFTAKTVDDAITAACRKFLVTSDKLEYEVIEEGSTGFLGFNAKPAKSGQRLREALKIRPENS